MTGVCFNIQRYSIHDGPGIRTTVFFKGCPLSCCWCHNPEGLSSEPEILFVAERCVGCGACSTVCAHPPPEGSPLPTIGAGRNGGAIDRSRCVACGRCVDACHAGARRRVGRSLSVDEVLKEVERDRPFYEASGGGVTFSGGEPLLQGPFLLACLEECRARDLHAAVDTSGYADAGLVSAVARRTDLFLYDLKVLDSSSHSRLTGVPLEPILENLRLLDDAGAEIWIRFPLIPGVTDDRDNLEALGRFVSSLENTRRVHVLPFHGTARDKYERLGRGWDFGRLRPDAPAAEKAAERLREFDLDVRQGG